MAFSAPFFGFPFPGKVPQTPLTFTGSLGHHPASPPLSFQDFVSKGVFAIIGTAGAPGAGADLSTFTFPEKIIWIGGGNGVAAGDPEKDAQAVQDSGRYSFSMTANTLIAGSSYNEFMLREIPAFQGAKTLALLFPDIPAGHTYADQTEKAAARYGIKVVAKEFSQFGTADFAAILTRIKGADPDVFFYFGVIPQLTSLILKTALDLEVANIGYNGWVQPLTDPLTFGPGGGPIGVPFATSQWPRAMADEDDPLVVEWRAKYAERTGQKPEDLKFSRVGVGIVHYEAVKCFAQAIEFAQSVDPDDVVEAMTNPDFECKDSLMVINWNDLDHDIAAKQQICSVLEGEVKCYRFITPAVREPGNPLDDPNFKSASPSVKLRRAESGSQGVGS